MSEAKPPLGTTWTPLRAATLAGVLAIAVYGGALGNGFAYDDHVLIAGDPGIRQLDGLATRLMEPSWPAVFGDEIGAWRPVTTGTWALTYVTTGGSEVAFHALGVVLHGLVTFLGVLILAEFTPLLLAGAAGLLFAVHPVHVEAVANVAGSAELISASFLMWACLVHVRGGARYRVGRVAAVTVLYALAVLAKEGAAVLPLLLVLLDGLQRDVEPNGLLGYVRERFLLGIAMTAALATVLVFRLDVVGAVAAASHPPGAETLIDAPRVWTVFSTWPEMARLLIAPFALSADYAPGIIPVVFGWSGAAVTGAGSGLLVFAGALVVWRRSTPPATDHASGRIVAWAPLWAAAALLPTANVLYLGPVLVAERTLYVASWGICAAGGWATFAAYRRYGREGAIAVCLLVAAFGFRTVTRVPVWDSTDSVMEAMLDTHPESGTGWMAFGRRLATDGNSQGALTAFGNAMALLNSEYRPATELGAHLLAMNRPDAARFFLRRAWREHPEWYTAPGLLAATELAAGRPEAAIPAGRAASFLQPENPSMHHLLAQAYALEGRWDEAVAARRESIDRGFADRGRSWILLATELASAGDTSSAVAALDSASARTLDAQEQGAWDRLASQLQGAR